MRGERSSILKSDFAPYLKIENNIFQENGDFIHRFLNSTRSDYEEQQAAFLHNFTGFSSAFRKVDGIDWNEFQLSGENEAVLDIYGAFWLSLSNNAFERNWSTYPD